jgi:hypothetical protein
MKVLRATVCLAVCGGAAVAASTAFVSSAAAAPAPGAVYVISAQAANNIDGRILLAGAIADNGKTVSIDKDGKPDANGNYVKITLRKGGFEINATTLNTKPTNPSQSLDKATCSGTYSVSGPVTLFDGTGLYQYVSGTVTVTITSSFLGPLYKSGAKKGQCNLGNNVTPIAQDTEIIGKGTVRFG